MVAIVSATSCPYAPTFCTGVAPVDPGMPERVSTPASPRSTVRATRSSHGSPAATRSVTPAQALASSSVTPRVAIRTTVPSKPASPTSRLEPPPSTRTGSPRPSHALIVSMIPCVLVAVTSRRAGPPTCRVVRPASGTPVLSVGSPSGATMADPLVADMSVTAPTLTDGDTGADRGHAAPGSAYHDTHPTRRGGDQGRRTTA